MKTYYKFEKYKKNYPLEYEYSLKRNTKSETYKFFNHSIIIKTSYLEKIWGFHIFFEKKRIHSNSRKKIIGLTINISNQNKFWCEMGNILAFPEIFSLKNIQSKNIPVKFRPKPLYIDFQYDINRKMRAILIDWLIDVHYKFKLVPSTLYVTINLIDRFLSLHIMVRQKLQLLGISSMLLASKYEEVYAPETRDFVYISNNVYSKEDIFKMEILICTTLEYTFHISSPIFFISYFSKILDASQEEIIFSVYIFELHLVDYDSLAFQVDVISIGSILNSICLLNNLGKKIDRINFFKKLNGNLFCFQDLKKCIDISNSLLILNQNSKRKLTSCKRKFSNKKFKEISEITFSVFF